MSSVFPLLCVVVEGTWSIEYPTIRRKIGELLRKTSVWSDLVSYDLGNV